MNYNPYMYTEYCSDYCRQGDHELCTESPCECSCHFNPEESKDAPS